MTSRESMGIAILFVHYRTEVREGAVAPLHYSSDFRERALLPLHYSTEFRERALLPPNNSCLPSSGKKLLITVPKKDTSSLKMILSELLQR